MDRCATRHPGATGRISERLRQGRRRRCSVPARPQAGPGRDRLRSGGGTQDGQFAVPLVDLGLKPGRFDPAMLAGRLRIRPRSREMIPERVDLAGPPGHTPPLSSAALVLRSPMPSTICRSRSCAAASARAASSRFSSSETCRRASVASASVRFLVTSSSEACASLNSSRRLAIVASWSGRSRSASACASQHLVPGGAQRRPGSGAGSPQPRRARPLRAANAARAARFRAARSREREPGRWSRNAPAVWRRRMASRSRRAGRPPVAQPGRPQARRARGHAETRTTGSGVPPLAQKRTTPKSRSSTLMSWNNTTPRGESFGAQLSKSCRTAS